MVALKREPKEEAPIHGDVLETIFSFVPLINLVPSCHVSKSWNKTVFSSLAHVRQIKPWLIVLPQTSRASRVTTAYAYDPRSHAWLQITKHQPLIDKIPEIPAVRSSHSTLLYTLSPSEFAFSLDALHLEWHKAPSPRVWRTDPIVARVGNHVVVAGGACDFEDDPLAVEMYDMETRGWITCQSMPMILKTSSASSWLSVAVVGETMLVTEKNSGVTYLFNTVTMKWEGPYNLRPDESVFYTVTGTLSEKLTVAGLVGEPGNVREVKLWAVKEEIGSGMEEIGSMPKEMVEKLKGDSEFGNPFSSSSSYRKIPQNPFDFNSDLSMADEAKAKGNAAFSSGDFATAIRHFSDAINLSPTNHVLYSNRSAAHASLQNYTDALTDAKKTVELKPDWSKGYSRLGAAHLGLSQYDEAVSAYKKGLEIDPNNEPLKSGLADAQKAAAASFSRPRSAPGANPFGDAFSGPEMWAKLTADPTTRVYLQQPDFVKMMQDIQKDPNNLNLYLKDQRVMQAFGVLLNVKIGRGGDDVDMPDMPSSSERKRAAEPEVAKQAEVEPEPEPEPMEEVADEEKEVKQRKAEAQKEKEAGN